MSEQLCALCQQLVAAGQFFHSRGWVPATSSNFSARIDEQTVWVTRSGQHKGYLDESGFLQVDLQGQALEADKCPSAETGLHTLMYRRDPAVGCVLHTHSVYATLLSLRFDSLELTGYELQKAMPGVSSHLDRLVLPVFPNNQDIPALATEVSEWLDKHPQTQAYLIRGHGMYTWGSTVTKTRHQLEALEFLLECHYRMLLLDQRGSQ